jgi:hypothetical protein
MLRWLARTVALLTVLAATVNAQCAVSCALITAPTEQKEDHSCCRHHRVPAHSCLELDSHRSNARLDVHRAVVPEPALLVQTRSIELTAPRSASADWDVEAVLQPPDTVASIAILRI